MANATPYKAPPKQISVSSLLSPPEMKRSESFGSSVAPSITSTPFSSFKSEQSHPAMAAWLPEGPLTMHRDATLTYASPPISPYDSESQKENMDRMDVDCVRDPQLFVRNDTASSISPDEPLFPQEHPQVDPAAQDLITKHMQSADFAALESKPARADYELAVSFVSNVHTSYNKSPRSWYEQEREFDRQYSQSTRGVQKRQPLKKLAPAPSARAGSKPKIALPRLARPARAPRAPKRTPKTQVSDSFDDFAPTSESPKPARPAGTRDDTDYNSLPDFSPPLETLTKGNTSALKTEWKGSALKLHDDPDRHLLHEAEIPLAGTLRLTCATYLCSKRRIFQARIEALRINKEFRKTDAQQACKIDVNKASKLWSVYDKVGWFDPKYFVQYV